MLEETGQKRVFKVLSIDGGGIKGLYSATILQHLEEKFDVKISDYFDMLCGTSTGGLLALGLSLKISAKEMAEFYIERGATIFPHRSKISNIIRQVIWKGKYSDVELRKALEEKFGTKLIGESNNLLCIPSYILTESQPWIFKKDFGKLDRDDKAKYVDVALATSAAPTYFPIAEIEHYDKRQFIDGGVWANNPTLVGYLEALTYFVGPQKEFDELQILSVSSLTTTSGKPIGLKRSRSFIDWSEDLFETSMIGQSHFVDYYMSRISDISNVPITYVRIPSVKVAPEQQAHVQLDSSSEHAINLIRGKGNDQGQIYKKLPEIEQFFTTPKQYKFK